LLHSLVLAFGFGLITASVLALAGVGVTLQFGVTNYVNFAYGAYLALSAFLAWTLNVVVGLDFWVAVAISTLVIAVCAVVVNRVLLQPFARRKLPTVYMLIVTLGLWLILSNVVLVLWGASQRHFSVAGQHPVEIGPFLFTPSQLLIIAVAVVCLVGVHLLLTQTKLGKAMRAMSDDSGLAAVSGIDTDRVVDATWFLTGALIGLSGCVLALNLSSFLPTFGDDFLFVIFSAVILGGIGHPYGTMIGALIVGLATEMSAVLIQSSYKSDVAFALLIIMLLVRPRGLIPSRAK
jgi:branched-subunit amino acid ABC-type transport system permease component